MIYVWEGSNYVSLAVTFSCIVNADTGALKNKCSLKILQVSVENTCVRKHLCCRPSGLEFHCKESPTQVFSCKIFKNNFCYRTTLGAAF